MGENSRDSQEIQYAELKINRSKTLGKGIKMYEKQVEGKA